MSTIASNSPDGSSTSLGALGKLLTPFHNGARRTEIQIHLSLIRNTANRRPNQDQIYRFVYLYTHHEITDHGRVLEALTQALADNGDLVKFRLVSKKVAAMMASTPGAERAFEKLYVHPLYTFEDAYNRDKRTKASFAVVTKSGSCRHLVIDVKNIDFVSKVVPGSIFSDKLKEGEKQEGASKINDWHEVLKACPNLESIAVRTARSRTGSIWNRSSSALNTFRLAFEDANLPKLKELRMAPVDMVYLGHFRWNNPAVGATSPNATLVWSKITKLEIQLHSIMEVGIHERMQVAKAFYAWLQSLAKNLKSLKFCYLDEHGGQHPFTILRPFDKKEQGQLTIGWPKLKSLWLGRVKNEDEYRHLLKIFAPKLQVYYALSSSRNYLKPVKFELHNEPHEQWEVLDELDLATLREPSREGSPCPTNYAKVRKQDAYHQAMTEISTKLHRPQQQVFNRGIQYEPGSVLKPHAQIYFRKVTEPRPALSFRRADSTSLNERTQEKVRTSSSSVVRDRVPPGPDDSPSKDTDSSRTKSFIHGMFTPKTPSFASTLSDQARVSYRDSRPRSSDPIRQHSTSLLSLFKKRSKSGVQDRQIVRVVGEPETTELPQDWAISRKTMSEKLGDYGKESVLELDRPAVLQLADDTKVGEHVFGEGTVFKAGSGTRLPDKLANQPLKKERNPQEKRAIDDLVGALDRARRAQEILTQVPTPKCIITPRSSLEILGLPRIGDGASPTSTYNSRDDSQEIDRSALNRPAFTNFACGRQPSTNKSSPQPPAYNWMEGWGRRPSYGHSAYGSRSSQLANVEEYVKEVEDYKDEEHDEDDMA